MIWTYSFPWASFQIQSTASAERPAWVQNALQSLSLRVSFWEESSAGWFSLTIRSISILGSATFIHASLPWIVITSFVIGIRSIMLGTTTPMIACAPKIVFAIDADFVLRLSQMPCCDSVRILLWAVSAASFVSSTQVESGFFCCLSRESSDLFALILNLGLKFCNFSWERNDLILFAKFTFPSSVFEHVIVHFDDFATDVSCIPSVRVSAKVSIANNVDFSFESLCFNC